MLHNETVIENNKNKIYFHFFYKYENYSANDEFFVKGRGESCFVNVSEIKLIFACAQYSEIILTGNKIFRMRVSLKEWESKLPSEIFRRVHRSTIVNINFVESHFQKRGQHFLRISNWVDNIEISKRKVKLMSDFANKSSIRLLL
ncbi:MAG: LytTR family transcriptional regulator [Melioribacteraceae bacterium]|nr:LytTR family transcriptional regulator [Melioribacteraceae bacterium]